MDADRTITSMTVDVICSNGSGWSPDGRKMYYTESFRYAIFVTISILTREPFRTGGPSSPSIATAVDFRMA